jgi:hypothetical protein
MPIEAITAVAKAIETGITERMNWLRMLSPEQLKTILDMQVKGEKVGFDIFIEPLIDLVQFIKDHKQ